MNTDVFISFCAVQIYRHSYIHLHSSSFTGVLRTHDVIGLIAKLVEHCTGIAGHGFESPPGLNFFQALFSQLLKMCK